MLISAENITPSSDLDAGYPPLTLNVSESSIISIISPDSATKILWLKTLKGINAIAKGELALLGENIREIDRPTWLALQKSISFVGQDAALLSAYTVQENIILPALYHKLAGREDLIKQSCSLLDEIGINDKSFLNQLPAYISPLQDYYTRIVRALIVKPKLLFLDNLYAHLSLSMALSLKRFLENKVEVTGLSIVLTSNNIKQVINESTTVVFVSANKTITYKNQQDMLKSGDASVIEYLSRYDIN